MSTNVLKKLVVDLFLISGLLVCLYASFNLWTPFQRGFFCGDQSLMMPYQPNTITVPMLWIFELAMPISALLICELALLRKEHDELRCLGVRIPVWLRGSYCAAISFCLGLCFQELSSSVAKKSIGRLRPHFFEVCQPSVNCSAPEWQGRYVHPHEYHCRGRKDEVNLSFLSGHASWSAYTMIFLVVYLEKRMVWRGTRVLRHVIQFAAMLLSCFVSLSRISDYQHHWNDVLAGYLLGATIAVLMSTWGTDLVKIHGHTPLPQHDLTLKKTSRQSSMECHDCDKVV